MLILQVVARKLGVAVKRGTTGPAYLALIAALAFGLTVSMSVPFGGVLAVAVLLAVARWRAIVLCSSLGSSLGALVVYLLFHHLGWSQFIAAYPEIARSNAWGDATRWLEQYGSFGLFAISALPLPQTPALIFAGIYRMPVPEVWLAIFLGKIIKYGVYAAIVSAFPERYSRRYASLLAAARHADRAANDGGSAKGKPGDDATPKHAAHVS
jgi:membrane protein YqaA with SNARE-associated domain